MVENQLKKLYSKGVNKMPEQNVEANIVEEVAAMDSGKGLKILGIAGIILLAGGVVYQYVYKPMKAKRKAQKEAAATPVETTEGEAKA